MPTSTATNATQAAPSPQTGRTSHRTVMIPATYCDMLDGLPAGDEDYPYSTWSRCAQDGIKKGDGCFILKAGRWIPRKKNAHGSGYTKSVGERRGTFVQSVDDPNRGRLQALMSDADLMVSEEFSKVSVRQRLGGMSEAEFERSLTEQDVLRISPWALSVPSAQ